MSEEFDAEKERERLEEAVASVSLKVSELKKEGDGGESDFYIIFDKDFEGSEKAIAYIFNSKLGKQVSFLREKISGDRKYLAVQALLDLGYIVNVK